MLYACYDLIQLDLIMEISWRYGLHDYTMVNIYLNILFPCLRILTSDE